MRFNIILYRISNRWRKAKVAMLHWLHRNQNADAYMEIDQIINQYRQGGGLSHSYQGYKLFELSALLKEMRPTSILELGTGTTSAVIANYVRAVQGARATMVDQSKEWLEHSRALAKIDRNDERFELVSTGVIEDSDSNPPCVYYDINFGNHFDLVIIDGPSLTIDGRKNKLAVNSNVLYLMNNHLPRAILIDIRKATVDAVIERYGHFYDICLSDVLSSSERHGYKYFTVLRRMKESNLHS